MIDIEATIPHRPPFLFVDRVVEQNDTGIVTERVIREEEPQFEGHYPGNPIMPGVLLCEATFQSAAIFLVEKLKKEGGDAAELTPVLSRITEAKFKQMVKPGDTIRIAVTFTETVSRFHFLRARVTNQDDKVVMTNAFALALV